MKLFGRNDWNYHGLNRKTKSFYDENGFDIRGYDKKGYDKKGFNIHGFDIKRIHKKTKTKFDEDGYDKHRFGSDGYGKDGFDKKGYDKKGYDRNGIHKSKKQNKNQKNDYRFDTSKDKSKDISDSMRQNWQRKNPPMMDYGNQSHSSSSYSVTQYWALANELIQNETESTAAYRMFLGDELDVESDSIEDKDMRRKLIEKFGTPKISPELGKLTEKGYDLYLSLLHVIGKNTVYGAPKKKSKLTVPYGHLHQLELVSYDRIEREYFLSSRGDELLHVLATALSNNSTCRIG